MPDLEPGIQVVSQLPGELRTQVEELIETCRHHDHVSPLNEAALIEVRSGRLNDGIAHQLAFDGARLVGYAHLDSTTDNPVAQVAVDPAYRRRGVATAMMGALGFNPRVPERGHRLALGVIPQVWAFGDLPAARAFAASFDWTPVRELLIMARPLTDVPTWQEPEGVRFRAFTPADTAAWLRVNARAFAHHPEQGMMTDQDLADRMAEPWFEADGFLVAVRDRQTPDAIPAGPQGDEELVGFHWTKRHNAKTGEVYVIGVDPDFSGGGLGRQLLSAGMDHLRAKGASEVILYVEADQRYVVDLYKSAKFEVVHRDVMYSPASAIQH